MILRTFKLASYRSLLLCLAALSFASAPVWAGGSKDTSASSATSVPEKVVYQEGFEDGTVGGWSGRSSNEKLSASTVKVHSGTYALYVSGRKATWNAPMKDVSTTLKGGKTYRISFWAMFEKGPESQALNVSMQKTSDGGGQTFGTIGADRMARGEWTKFEIEYTVPREKYAPSLALYFETPWKPDAKLTANDLIDFYIDDVTITLLPPAPPPEVEKDIPPLYTFMPGIPLGVAVTAPDMNPENIHFQLFRHFNAFVMGNEMKQDGIQKVEGKFTFAAGDAMVEYTQKTGTKMRGHTLVWHQQVPDWFFQSPSDPTKFCTKEQLLDRLHTHIATTVGHFKGKIDSWDVVNECIDNGKLRDDNYFKIVGSDEYIAKAFQWAREADPNAKLFINDYNVEYSGAKQDGLYNLVKKLKAEGVPIDGVGFQTHISIASPSVNDLREAIRRFSALGVKIQITELDMSIYANGGEPKRKIDRDTLLDQAFKYRALFDMFKEEAAAGRLDMVVIWGLSDDETWLDNHPTPGRIDYPLFFGKDLRSKPAYWAIVNQEKLPIQIRKAEALRTKAALSSGDAVEWNFVTSKSIIDRKGTTEFGRFKLAWTAASLQTLITVYDSTKDPSDEVQIFFEPKNVKAEVRPVTATTLVVKRENAIRDDGKSYTVLASIPFGGEGGKLDSKVGFDIRLKDGATLNSWTDYSNSQDTSSTNYGTVLLKDMPAFAFAKRGTVSIDGQIDAVWNSVQPVPMNLETQGATEKGSQFRALWDDQYVYVLVEVQDKLLNDSARNPWEQDSVEVFIDQNNGKTTIYESDDAQYRVSFHNTVSFNGGDSANFKSATQVVPGGYRVEVAIPMNKVKPVTGNLLGFEVQINESDASGARTGIRNWFDKSNQGYQNTSSWGVLMLQN